MLEAKCIGKVLTLENAKENRYYFPSKKAFTGLLPYDVTLLCFKNLGGYLVHEVATPLLF